MSSDPGTNARFTQTHWSVVLAAQAGETRAGAALEELCRKYWYPVYAFIRRQGRSPHDAQDLTQGFFAHLLRRDWLANVAPDKGRFRSFLLACLKNFLRNVHAAESGPARHPGQPLISFDAQEAEARYRLEPADENDPAILFQRRWALNLVERVLAELKAQCAAKGKAETFNALHPFLVGEAGRGDYAPAAARLNISDGAARKAASDLRARYRELLRSEIAATVENDADIDQEISDLFSLVGR